MNIGKLNNLLELFFLQYQKQNQENILLNSLKDEKNKFSWKKTFLSVKKLSNDINNYTKKGDRCLLISENRPEWFITDLSIMLSESITVPTYTTYSERDYDYIINDSKPTIVFVSDNKQFNKIKNIIKKNSFIKKIYSF